MSNSLWPMDCGLPGSSVHGILQARTLEWFAMSFSRGSSHPRDQTHIYCVSYIGRWVLYHLRHLGGPGNWSIALFKSCFLVELVLKCCIIENEVLKFSTIELAKKLVLFYNSLWKTNFLVNPILLQNCTFLLLILYLGALLLGSCIFLIAMSSWWIVGSSFLSTHSFPES